MTDYRLGKIRMETDLILAPMMDIGTPSFRQLIIDEGGVGMIFTPMIFLKQMAVAPKTVLPHLELIENQRPSVVQIVSAGKENDVLKDTMEILNTFNFDAIDINSGCPSRRTMNSGGGGGLIKEFLETQYNPDSCEIVEKSRLSHLIESVQKYSDKPVSVKTRLGLGDRDDILEMARIFDNLGIEFLTIHGRTVQQKYSGDVHHDMIKLVKDNVSIPIVGNGDVRDFSSYQEMKQESRCDAVMIGRAAKSQPWIFHEINTRQKAEEKKQTVERPVDHDNIENVRHFLEKDRKIIEGLSPFWNNSRFLLAEIRRLSIWMIKGIKGYKAVREKLSKMREFEQLWSYIYSTNFENDCK